MLLSDVDLWEALSCGDLEVSPMSKDRMQPASIEMHLGNGLEIFTYPEDGGWAHQPLNDVLDPLNLPARYTASVSLPYELPRNGFALASTLERVALGDNLAARVEGKSSLGRLGLGNHVTAGFIDPGFRGTVTLELHNVSPSAILLTAGMPIGQLCVFRLSSPAERPYGHPELRSRYQGQQGTTPSHGVDQPKQNN